MSDLGKIEVDNNPLLSSQQKLCKRFISVFGLSIFEVVDTTFFDWNTRLNFFGDASVFFMYNQAYFTLSYEISGLDYGFLLACKDGDSAFFPVINILSFWHKNSYRLEDFTDALEKLARSAV